jgi:2-oxoglutarate/2-oxoacid ferredoxin oxidoreductase subunit beta
VGQKLKYAGVNELPPLDLCIEALVAECGFVARSFAGDAKQVRELLKAAMSYKGTAVLDIISPCVTFNNHEDSTKSYPYGKEHEERLHDITFIAKQEEIQVDYEAGTVQEVQLHNGPVIQLRKLEESYDPTDRLGALRMLETARANQEFITGLIYVNESRPTLPQLMNLPETPLVQLPEASLRPPREALDKVMASLA